LRPGILFEPEGEATKICVPTRYVSWEIWYLPVTLPFPFELSISVYRRRHFNHCISRYEASWIKYRPCK